MSHSESRRRVVVALGFEGASSRLVELGAIVATRLGIELATVVIEDVNLMVLTGLPFAVEIDRVSASARRLDPSSRERAMRAIERTVGKQLRDLGRAQRLTTSLKLLQGEPWSTALAAATAEDVLVLGRGTTLAWMAGDHGVATVAVIYESATRDVPALEIAAGIAQAQGARLELIMPGIEPAPDEALFREAAGLLAERRIDVALRATTAVDLAEALQRIATARVPLLVVSRGLQESASDAVRTHLDRAGRVLIVAP